MFLPARTLAAILSLAVALSTSSPSRAEPANCSDLPPPVAGADWISSCKHALCGFVSDASASAPPDKSACAAQSWAPMLEAIRSTLANGGVVALGEVHDNATHHRTRAELLKGAKSVVFEQIRTDKSAKIDVLYKGSSAVDSDQIIKTVEWESSGWPIEDYKPLIESAVATKARVYAGDATKTMMKSLAMGEDSLKAEDRARLALDVPLGRVEDEASLTEIEQSHCGMMPKDALGGMAAAQRYRDASLADATLTAVREHGSSVLIAGNGHVRTDRGVPWYLAKRVPKMPVLSIVFVETEDGETAMKDYGPRTADGQLAADFIVFTPKPDAPRGDPCERFKAKKKAG